MDKATVLSTLRKLGLVPVLRARSLDEAILLAEAVAAAGVTALEITMTVPGAIKVLERLTQRRPDLLLGAGTVLDPETARICTLAGAQFIASPSINLRTIEMCDRYSIAVLPGALTPTEIVTAWQAGADVVRVFPAFSLGGAQYLKALKGPLPQIDMIPTGGVTLANAADFLAAGAFALGVGSDLANPKALAVGKPEIITETARQFMAIVAKYQAEAEENSSREPEI
jgi:2-dehydro-3-deoxyphosphogluconate aldolase/(4S)-4-hydroxy-2-oxoglutarate aldolase